MKTIKQRITDHLKNADTAAHVEDIRISCNIGNWNTALKHCLELLIAKQIQGQRTSHGWIFWADKEAQKT
jgi:hypothetical protein